MPVKPKSDATAIELKTKARVHRLLAVLLATAFAWALSAVFVPTTFSNWPEALLLALATAGTLAALARQLPLQNVLLAALVIALIGGGVSALGTRSGIPFGPFLFGAPAGPELFGALPWAAPLLWVVVILNSRGVARLILRPWRKIKNYGFWLIGLTTALTVLFDLALEPFAARLKHYWLWTPTKFPLTWQGAPLSNFFGWGMVTLLILAFVTPALINKQLSKRSSPDFHPLGVWLGAILLFAAGSATRGLWPSVAVDAAIGIMVTVLAIRGGRW
jgi:uncharacterized membrane protein